MLDVAKEQRVRADHQDPLALERKAMRVKQVGRSMQRHRRLARPWATLDDQHARQARPDDLVLLGLYGPDDVTHLPGPGLTERRQQCPRSAQSEADVLEALAPVAADGRRCCWH